MKKIIVSFFSLCFLALLIYGCKREFLERRPLATLDEAALTSKAGVEGLLIGAYSMLDGIARGAGIFIGGFATSGSNWIYGSVAGGDAHKGSDAGDIADILLIERYDANSNLGAFNDRWVVLYEGVHRANQTLRIMKNATDIEAADQKRIEGEARFLRGHYHFELKRMWNKVPFVDETKTALEPENFKLGNDADIWPQIEADIRFAYDNLPAKMDAIGRVNKWAAGAYLGKVLLYQKKFPEARTVLDAVYAQGVNPKGTKYSLLNRYQDNFNAETENSTESVFAVQYSVNDGAQDAANGGWGDVLNFPHNSGPGGCCGFYQPSQELVNSYKVDPITGVPMANYNSNEVPSDQGVPSSGTWIDTVAYKKGGFVTALESSKPFTERVYKALSDNKNVNPISNPATWELAFVEPSDIPLDPRLDWSVGRRGIPYLDHGPHPGQAWIRDQVFAGPYSPKKNVFYKSQRGKLTDRSFWTSGVTANNYTLIRFADVILMLAEAEVEAGSLVRAQQLVDQVRARAANPESWVRDADGSPAANYKVGLYDVPFASKEAGRSAVYFERKLELAMEGHRFFDLVRWGIAAPALNAYLLYEGTQAKNNRSYLKGAQFQTNQDEFFPIPQRQIDLSGGNVKQNPGY